MDIEEKLEELQRRIEKIEEAIDKLSTRVDGIDSFMQELVKRTENIAKSILGSKPSKEVLGAVLIVFGIFVLVFPQIVGYLLGALLVAEGIYTIVK